MTREMDATLTGAAVAAALLTAEHLALYPVRDTLHPTARYTLGVAALGIGHTVACALVGDARAAWRLWAVVAAGGGAVLAGYAARGELPGRDEIEEAVRDVTRYVRRVGRGDGAVSGGRARHGA